MKKSKSLVSMRRIQLVLVSQVVRSVQLVLVYQAVRKILSIFLKKYHDSKH